MEMKRKQELTRLQKIKKIISKTFKILFKFTLLLIFTASLFTGFYVLKTVNDSPKITESLLNESVGETSNMYATDGTIIWSDTEHIRDYIKIEDVPDNYKKMLLATEDKDFYTNPGFDFKALINAVLSRGRRGGSGINQQLVKNVSFSSSDEDRTIKRKIQELFLSIQMEKNFSKDKILEYYINLINMGEGSYGANTIAITYYNQSLKDLTGNDASTISKLAIIAGLGQAPSTYNLYDNPEAVEKRREEVLLSALREKIIDENMYEEVKKVPVQEGLQTRYWRNTNVLEQGKEHSAYIASALEQIKDLGYDLNRTPMQIYTALDTKVNSEVKSIFDNFYGYQDENMQAAGTFIDPNTGYVMAQYGGRYGEAFGLNRATQKTRSSGSSTKPWISYGPAIEYFGKGSGTLLDSSNYTYPGTSIVARNYGGATYGNISMAKALKWSLNTPAIRLLDEVTGSANTKKFLSGIGMDVNETYGGQDALGLNISTQQLAAAQATLANLGTYKTPQYITKIKFNDNSEKEIILPSNKAMNESTAYILLRMMEEVPRADGTARFAILPYSGYAVKTGTVGYDSSYGFGDGTASDLWIGGTTKSVSAGFWVGYDTPYEYGNQIYESVYHNHQVLFKQLMQYFNEGKDTSQWEKPSTVTGNSVESLYPTDYGQNVSSYSIPKLDSFDSSVFKTFSTSTSNQLNDLGFDKYKTPSDYDKIINWENNIDKDKLTDFNNYKGDALKAIINKENVYITQNVLNKER